MNEQARQKLRELIVHHGPSLCDEPERCKVLLQDACPTSRRETFVLVSALEEQVVADLLAGVGGRSWDAVAGRLARRLVDNRALADHAASWAVESSWERCWDWYDERDYRSSPGIDPFRPEWADDRTFRGGSWCVEARYLRSAYRDRHAPQYRHSTMGFRVARGSSVR
jgi:hypothetical protein